MADNKQKPGNPDKSRINVNEEYELNNWSKKFGINRAALKNAVEAVGTAAADVESFLKNNKASNNK